MWERIAVIVRKELILTLRDPKMRILLFFPPLLQLLIFGVAVNLDVENNRIAWMDQDNSPESRELLRHFEGSRYFIPVSFPGSEAEVERLLDRGSVPAVVRVLPGFGSSIRQDGKAAVQVLIDGTNSNTAGILSNYTSSVIAGFNLQLQREKLESMGVGTDSGPGISLESRIWFNPTLRSQYYFVPGVVVNIIALTTIMLTAMAVVREKEVGTMEQLLVTPIRPIELMLGKTLPFALIGLIDVAMVTVAALIIFGIPFEGSALFLLTASILFLLTTLGVGLLISTISRTQQQAMMGTLFFFLPAFMLSGFAFPIANMPEPVKYLTLLNPLRYFLEIVRGVFLKGTGTNEHLHQMTALLVFGLGMVLLSALRFTKRLD